MWWVGNLNSYFPLKILASKRLEQVGSITSGERGTNIIMISAIYTGGNFMSFMLIFSKVRFKPFMFERILDGIVEAIGMAIPFRWLNEDLFYEFFQYLIKQAKITLIVCYLAITKVTFQCKQFN